MKNFCCFILLMCFFNISTFAQGILHLTEGAIPQGHACYKKCKNLNRGRTGTNKCSRCLERLDKQKIYSIEKLKKFSEQRAVGKDIPEPSVKNPQLNPAIQQ